MAERENPTARQAELGGLIRSMREAAKMSAADLAARLKKSKATLSRMERGKIGLSEALLIATMDHLGVEDPQLRTDALQLRAEAEGGGQGWEGEPEFRAALKPGFATQIGNEREASVMRSLDLLWPPGLTQSPEIAELMARKFLENSTESNVRPLVEAKMRRQESLTRDVAPLTLWAVIPESVLQHSIGDSEILRGAALYMADMMENYQNVNVHVIPNDSAGMVLLTNSFAILSFPESWRPDVVCVPGLTSTRYLEDPAEARAYRNLHERMMMQYSLRRDQSLSLIRSYAAKP
ncbi:helix-turn-helix domain-containing protein [Kitasatospora sp. NPDC001309]|uniref:helix-turn-helix domain-containing protein n=1 Tax=Kitasatospora sp. NPDC001309 TaxID=3364013 RepID=UPI003685BC75